MGKAKKRSRTQGVEGGSEYGPPVRTISGHLGGGSGASDDWQTTPRSWAAIADIIQVFQSKRVWMPFYYDGQCAEHVRALGFERVYHRPGEDFFVKAREAKFLNKVDLILDNPPYTSPEMKEAVLRALAATGKPFVMLLPISVLHVGFVREILDADKVQAIIPRRVYVKKTNAEEVTFKYLCWLCYRVKLPRDLILVDDGDGDDEPPLRRAC